MKQQSNNILHLMGMDSTKYGGIERFNVELSCQLAERGYHSVFVYERWPDVEQFAVDLQRTGAEIVVLSSRRNPLKFLCQIWSLFHKYHFQMMHAHFTPARFYAIPLALLRGIRKVYYTLHSTIPPLNEIKYHTRLWYKICNMHCSIIVVSKGIEKIARQNWPQAQIKNLYLGIAPCIADRAEARKELQIPTDTLMVMCTANFNHIKGLDILVKAIVQLQQKIDISKVIFYIVGQPDDDKAELQQLIDELKLSSYVHLEGISNHIPTYLNAADMYIQPSRSEGIGLAIMEACSVGLPIMASRVGGIPEVAIEGENAILFEVENVNECASALRTMLTDASLRKKLGEKSKQVYEEKFQLSNNVNKLIEYYNLK